MIKQEEINGLGKNMEKLTVQKSQPLVSLWNSALTLQEFKILDTYLSRIDSHKPERRSVMFEKGELERLLGVQKINNYELKERLKHLMSNVVEVPDSEEKKGFKLITLFEEAEAEQDKNGIWRVKLACTKKAMKYFFNIENLGYLRYKIKCITSITSRYTYIMFMYLESNRYRGTWEIPLEELKKILSCHKEDTYKEYKHFNNLILKKIQKELQDKINYQFNYSPVKCGRSVVNICFSDIRFNENAYLSAPLEHVIDMPEFQREETELWEDALDPLELTNREIAAIKEYLVIVPNHKLPQTPELYGDIQLMRYHYLKIKVAEILQKNETKPIKNKYAYLTKLLKADVEK